MTNGDCQCAFEYHYRWPQFYGSFLARDPTAVELLDERDRALELHFNQRCDLGGDFEYPVRWSQLHDGLLSADATTVAATVAILEERDQALQVHIAGLPCFGIDYSQGITCEFEYPTRWAQLAPMLLSDDPRRLREAVALLQVRDIELETHLTNRVCHPVECADDDFERTDLGSAWADVNVHKAPYTHAPVTIGSGNAISPEDTTGNVWSEVRYTRLTTDPTAPSFIEATLINPFAGTGSPTPISVTYELFLDLAGDGSCEALTLTFVTVPPPASPPFGYADQQGQLTCTLGAYDAAGSQTVIVTRVMSIPDDTSPITIGFQSYGTGFYRVLLDDIDILSGTQTVDRPLGTNVGFGMNWTTTGTGGPPGISSVSMCGHAGTPRGDEFFTDDCENFTAGPWTVTGSSAIGTPPSNPGRTGNCFLIYGGTGNTVSYDIPTPNQTDRLTLGVWFYFSTGSLPGTVVPIISFRSDTGATDHLVVYLDGAGFLGVRQGGGTGGAFLDRVIGPGLFTLDAWHYFEFTVHLADSRGSATVQIDGTEVFTTTNQDTKIGGTKTVFDQIRFHGPNFTSGSASYRVDDIYLRDDNLLSM